MKKIIFIFILSFLTGGCYIPFPSIGKSGSEHIRERIDKRTSKRLDRRPDKRRPARYRAPRSKAHTVIHCRKYMSEYGTITERCFRHEL